MFFGERTPLQDALRIQILTSEVALVGVDLEVGAQKHGAKFWKSRANGEKFFLHCRSVAAC
jgi:hypothetical protein